MRGFTQDDAHIFCLPSQLEDEIVQVLDLTERILKKFGFTKFEVMLSTRPEESVGNDEIWEKATTGLIGALGRKGWSYAVDEGGGAFYGPKIDIKIQDAIGRRWQCSTIQCDFNLPERFELEYIGSDNARHRPIMLHRALFGSVERFFGVLVEHFAGAFPTWLAPVQVRVLPVATAHEEYAAQVATRLRHSGFRVDVIEADEGLGKRVRNGKIEKIPYVLVVGDDDIAAGTIGVNVRGSDGAERGVSVEEFITRLDADVAEIASLLN